MERSTSIKIEYARFIAGLLIVLNHSLTYVYFPETSDVSKTLLDFFSSELCLVSMSFYFTLTGFLLFKDIREEVKDITSLGRWYVKTLKKRFWSIMIPYLAWNAVWTLFVYIVRRIPYFSGLIRDLKRCDGSIGSILRGVLLFEYNAIFWYMADLIIIVCISPFLYLCIRNRYLGILFIAAVAVLSYCNIPGGLMWVINHMNDNGLMFFMIGSYVAVHKRGMIDKDYNKYLALAGMILWIAAGVVLFISENSSSFTISLLKSMIRIGRLYGFWLFVDLFRYRARVAILEISFFLYAMHWYVEKAVNKVFELVLPQIPLAAWINTIGGILFTVVIIYTIDRLMMKYTPRIFGILNGKRGRSKSLVMINPSDS